MDIALTLHADHELNASTFAARVAAATLTDMHSAIVAGIGTLKGPLHGGANAEVMKMLIEIGQDAPAERIDAYIKGQAGEEGKDLRLRSSRLQHRRSARDAPEKDVEGARAEGRQHEVVRDERAHRSARQRREEAVSERRLLFGVDVLHDGHPIDLYTPIFAVSRISGWTAHVLEQYCEQPPDPPARGLHRTYLSRRRGSLWSSADHLKVGSRRALDRGQVNRLRSNVASAPPADTARPSR